MKKLIFIVLVCVASFSYSQNYYTLKNLKGNWKFCIGDDLKRAKINYDDSFWDDINVPREWENEGFAGYDGYAWYRKEFIFNSEINYGTYYLELGYIDDVDEVYFNGHKIGESGKFPPNFSTAYSEKRRYIIPLDIINFKAKNLIAVRIYDSYMWGGICKGNVRILAEKNPIKLDINLQGIWKFDTQFVEEVKNHNWKKINVPGKIEEQGYRWYDGIMTYYKKFYVGNTFNNQKLVLLLGKIDDADAVYINDVFVGSTGNIQKSTGESKWQNFRNYYFDSSLLKKNSENEIIVIVNDYRFDGGIYQGPIGILTQKQYIKYWKRRKR